MSETQVRTTVLYEAAMIAAMRASLKAAMARIEKEAYSADETSTVIDRVRLACAIDAAEDALFHVLNIAHSHNHCDEAKAALGKVAG